MPSKKDNPSDPTTKDDLIDNVIEKMGGDFAKIDIRETSEIMGDSEDVRDRAKEIEDLVTSKKKTREWADTQEKYIRT